MENNKLKSKQIAKKGDALLNNTELNRATAFSIAERQKYGLLGLLPEKVETEAERLQRVLSQVESKSSDLARYEYLSDLRVKPCRSGQGWTARMA